RVVATVDELAACGIERGPATVEDREADREWGPRSGLGAALRVAAVVRHEVAVVAQLAEREVDDAVAASLGRRAVVRAAVAGGVIAVVALLAELRLDDAIAAARDETHLVETLPAERGGHARRSVRAAHAGVELVLMHAAVVRGVADLVRRAVVIA